jgi:hypothetical protein
MENPAYVQFLVDVDDKRKIDGLIATIQQELDGNYPNANSVVKKFLLGAWERRARAGAISGSRLWSAPPACR